METNKHFYVFLVKKKNKNKKMNAYKANLINAIALIIIGLFGYFSSETPSHTALIPVGAGIILVILSFGMKKHSRTQAHIAVMITFLVLIALIMPLLGAINRGDNSALIRVIIMMLTSLLAMLFFVKSFIDARRVKK